MQKVYLIDDSNAEDARSKFRQLGAFVAHLNGTFQPRTFEWGTLFSGGREQQHNDLLSGQPNEIIAVLSDPNAMVLVDVLMPLADCVDAGRAILNSYPQCAGRVLEIGRILTDNLRLDQTPDEYLLCAVIIAVGEAKCSRVAVVSTEAQNPARGAVGVLGPNEIGWNAAAWSRGPNAENIKAWVFQDILGDANAWKEAWIRMREETKASKWALCDSAGTFVKTSKLFPTGSHDLTDGRGNFTHSGSNADNAGMLEAATEWFEENVIGLNGSEERLAVLKAASRNSQIPVFVVQRILGIGEISDVTLAMSAVGTRWDAPVILFGFKKLASNEPRPRFHLKSEGGRWGLSLTVTGSVEELDKVESALRQGAVRRYRERGTAGELTLGIELLSPTDRERTSQEIVVSRRFNQEQL